MTNHGFSLLQTIESNAIGAAVGAIVGGTVSGLYKRAVRLEARRIEAALLTLDHLLGGSAAEPTSTTRNRFPTMFPTLAQFRKGIAAGFGVILIGVLTWAESADLEPVLGPLVPQPYRPLVGVFLGGVALTASVILAKNAPHQDGTASTTPAVDAAIAAIAAMPAAPSRPAASVASLVAGVSGSSAAVTSETSIVKLLDPPVRAYQ